MSESRGSHLVDAALDVLAGEGFAALSVRSVATAAGVSPAQVQYYFPTKARLVQAAFDHAGTLFLESIGPVLAEDPSPARLRRLLWRWLPLDPASERRARVWIAYASAAAVDPALAAASAALDAELRDWLGADLATLRDRGLLRSTVDPATAALQLLALVDGLTLHCLTLPAAARAPLAERALGAWLDALTTGPDSPAAVPGETVGGAV